MPDFLSAGVRIHYQTFGPREGAPVLLLHGFASSARVNWVSTGWTAWLAERGHFVIAPDFPGHGESEKLHSSERYTAPAMARDMARLLAHLNVPQAFVMGYSMGARVAAFLALAMPEKVCALVLAGLAGNLIRGLGGTEDIARALLAEDANDPAVPAWARGFRRFAEKTGGDLPALAACIRAARTPMTAQDVERLAMPVLVVMGENDDIAGDPAGLMPHLARGELLILPRRDHMNAVGDMAYKRAVSEFFARHRGRCKQTGRGA